MPPSAASSDEEDGSRQSQMVVAERTVQIPPAEEVHEKPRVRTSAALQSLQDELFELRAQLEGLQLELPDVEPTDTATGPTMRKGIPRLACHRPRPYGLTSGGVRARHA